VGSRAVEADLSLAGAREIWGDLGRSGEIWGDLGRFALYSAVQLCACVRGLVLISPHISPYLPISPHISPCPRVRGPRAHTTAQPLARDRAAAHSASQLRATHHGVVPTEGQRDSRLSMEDGLWAVGYELVFTHAAV